MNVPLVECPWLRLRVRLVFAILKKFKTALECVVVFLTGCVTAAVLRLNSGFGFKE
jgi:hypothetical protein